MARFLLESTKNQAYWCAGVRALTSGKPYLQLLPISFFTTEHYRNHASVLVRLERVGVAELSELLMEAWEARAPKRLKTQDS